MTSTPSAESKIDAVARAIAAAMLAENGSLEIWEDGVTVFDSYDNKTYDCRRLAQAAMDQDAVKTLRHGFLLGFSMTAEGYNADYPFARDAIDPETNEDWLKGREQSISDFLQEHIEVKDPLRQPEPEEIAAAWRAWHSRHGGKIGPGPAFVEAINAAFAERKKRTDRT